MNTLEWVRRRASKLNRKRPAGLGNIDRVLNGRIEGWVKSPQSEDPLTVDLLLNGTVIAVDILAGSLREDVRQAGFGTGCYGFSCPIPASAEIALVGGLVEVRLAADKSLLLSMVMRPEMLPALVTRLSTVTPPSQPKIYKLRIEKLSPDQVVGWAVDEDRKGQILDLDVLIDDVFFCRIRSDNPRGDLLKAGISEGLGGFRLGIFLNLLEPGQHRVTIVLPGGHREEASVPTTGLARRVRQDSGVPAIRASDVAIIVPIYNAADDVALCIQRLQQFTSTELEVLLIDDASPDPRIAKLLSAAEQLPGFRVLRNDQNLGFTRTINRGLDAVDRKHAILLNSDTRVTPGWAEGLLRAAASRPRLATVTPMSDRAGAFSAPSIGNDNVLPTGVDEITYARAFRQRALGLYPVVPTGNGFCMFVNRTCLDEIGLLDAEAFPRGYGEENDFCMRAGRAGWTHVVDDRTYVFHARSKSFGDEKTDLMAAGRMVVNERYPEYQNAIRVFSTGGDIAVARFRAAQAMADCDRPQVGLPTILYVVSTQTGGTPQTNMDLMQGVADEMEPWLLQCDSKKMSLSRLEAGKLVEVRSHLLAEPVDPLSHRSGEYNAVVRDWLEIANPSIVHIRHLAWHCLSLPAAAKAQGSKVVCSFHDFYSLCPTVKLLDERNVHCGGVCTASDGDDCRIELWSQADMPRIKNSWVHVWRQRFADVLRICDAFVTTSDSARARILSQLPGLDPDRFFVIPHGRNFTQMQQVRQHPQQGQPIRILVPGNISTAKGRNIITALLDHDRAGLLEFHILGKISEPDELKHYSRLVIHGTYARNDFSARAVKIGPNIGAIFSIWDETYCHTLTELWSAGIPAMVFDFPTVAGRVRASGAGWVLQYEDIAELYRSILDLSSDLDKQLKADAAVLRWQSGHGVGRTTHVMSAAYREVYRIALQQGKARPLIAVVAPSAPQLDRANASTEIRIWERTINSPSRECVFVRMTPQTLLANIHEGIVDGAIIQRNALPATMVTPLLEAMEHKGLRYLLDLDEDLLTVSAEKDPEGRYASYAPLLELLVRSAALVTVSTVPLRRKLTTLNKNVQLLPNRLSERLWRGKLPQRQQDGTIRALYMGTLTHDADFQMILPALAAVASANPNFRLGVIGVTDDELPAWAERIPVPDAANSYAQFVPWLKEQSARFDFALAPLETTPFNLFKSDLKVLDCAALGLRVLASDIPVYRDLASKVPELILVKNNTRDWTRALTETILKVAASVTDSQRMRDWVFAERGLASSLPEFDGLLARIVRAPNIDQASSEVPEQQMQ